MHQAGALPSEECLAQPGLPVPAPLCRIPLCEARGSHVATDRLDGWRTASSCADDSPVSRDDAGLVCLRGVWCGQLRRLGLPAPSDGPEASALRVPPRLRGELARLSEYGAVARVGLSDLSESGRPKRTLVRCFLWLRTKAVHCHWLWRPVASLLASGFVVRRPGMAAGAAAAQCFSSSLVPRALGGELGGAFSGADLVQIRRLRLRRPEQSDAAGSEAGLCPGASLLLSALVARAAGLSVARECLDARLSGGAPCAANSAAGTLRALHVARAIDSDSGSSGRSERQGRASRGSIDKGGDELRLSEAGERLALLACSASLNCAPRWRSVGEALEPALLWTAGLLSTPLRHGPIR
ncbi:unnamed protein product, partial [Symbiodinium sp. KB8]